jgi:hypothetical protein
VKGIPTLRAFYSAPKGRWALIYLLFVFLVLAYFLLPLLSDGGDADKIISRAVAQNAPDIGAFKSEITPNTKPIFRAVIMSPALPAEPGNLRWVQVDPNANPSRNIKTFTLDPIREATLNFELAGFFAAPPEYEPTKDGEHSDGIYNYVPLLSLQSVTIRWDRVILGIGVLLAVGLTLFWGVPNLLSPAVQNPEIQINDDVTSLGVLRGHVKIVENRANAIYGRSTLLLTVGVLMAFIGIGVFYFSLPPVPSVPRYEELSAPFVAQPNTVQKFTAPSDVFWSSVAPSLPRVLRSTGVLIFIEAIAWFLLRQYRSLIEDFKQFTRLYLKRANYLAAFVLLSDPDSTPESRVLAAALIQEDLSGVLRSGETLEAIEKEKIDDKNPIFTVLSTGLTRLGSGAKATPEANAIPESPSKVSA